VLDLGSNKLEGPLPAEWGLGLQVCEQIEMDGNHFNGTIPKNGHFFLIAELPHAMVLQLVVHVSFLDSMSA
jgi:hypothetical protein